MNPLHDSEKVVGRITRKGTWDRRYRRVYPKNPDESSIGELIAGILTLLIAFGAIFWALPVIAEAVR